MKRLWKSLALSLGVLATGARAQNAPAPTEPAVSIGRPVASIGRPVVLNQQPVAPPVYDPRLQPASFDAPSAPPGIPTGSAPAPGSVSSLWTYHSPQDEVAPRPQIVPAGPGSTNTGPVVSGPVLSGPAVGDGVPVGDDCTCGRWGWLGCNNVFNWLGSRLHGSCNDACYGDPCADGCAPNERLWVKGEYLLWWTRGQPTPPLLTTSVIPGAAPGFVIGSFADPNARILVGNNELNTDPRSGGRLQLGYWLTDDHLLGVDTSFFFLGDTNGSTSTTSNGNPLLFRPFIDVVRNIPSVELVAVSNAAGVSFLAGNFTTENSSSFWGGDFNLRTNLASGPGFFLDATAGFRYLRLDDTLNMNENLRVVNTFFDPTRGIVVPAGTTFLVNDNFQTKNQFYGGQLGLSGEYRRGPWVFGVDAKVGLGDTRQTADIIGTTSINGGSPLVGGLLAQSSNIGHFTRDIFTVVPEIGLNVGYQITPHCRAFVGYNFLWWSSVARAGNQIDLGINTAKIPPGGVGAATPDRPAFSFNGSDFWAQGINVGLMFAW